MLYVFRMDVGQMLTVDMSFLMDTVSRLQVEVFRLTGIPTDKQILLVSGGHSLKPDQKVISYGAGADTNPVFLFSRMAIENQDPPLIRAVSKGDTKDVLAALKDSLNKVMNMPPQIECVSMGTKIACQFRDSAARILSFCKSEFKEQHLQYQGWGTVVANLEEIASALQHSKTKFSKVAAAFLPMREQYFNMLDKFSEVMDLLQRIPLLKSLKEESGGQDVKNTSVSTGVGQGALPFSSRSVASSHGSFIVSTSFTPCTLLDWIVMQGRGRSLENLSHKCHEDLLMFNSQMFEHINHQVEQVLREVMHDPNQHKELVGIERRLSDLEKRYNEAAKITEEQNDVTQNLFLKHASNMTRMADMASLLPELCHTHQQQLRQMMERQQRINALHSNFLRSKQEMCTNIHQRLSWVMHIETTISKLDNELVFHMKTLKILECNLELLSQIKLAPKVYGDIVVEAARRRNFSYQYLQWAENLVEDSSHLYKSEIERRQSFTKSIGNHFLLDTLFKGLDDVPPNFATKAPKPFDLKLPEVTSDELELLWSSAPELRDSLRESGDGSSFPLSYPGKERTESPFAHIVFPTSQSSQTEWVEQPSVVTATEAPPTMFTLPELQESQTTHLPQVSTSQYNATPRHSGFVESHVKTHTTNTSLRQTSTDASTSPDLPPSTDSATSPGLQPSSSAQTVVRTGKSTVQPRKVASSATLDGTSSPSGARPHTSFPIDPDQQGSRIRASPSYTESTSPPSSTEFATADFYFEDSIPSPLASSSSERNKEDSGADVKNTKCESESSSRGTLVSIATLQMELANKDRLIKELQENLKQQQQSLSSSSTTNIASPPSSSCQQLPSAESLVTAVPSVSLSEGGSTPPMEDALDVSFVVARPDAPLMGTESNKDTGAVQAELDHLQNTLEQVHSDLTRAREDLLVTNKLKQDLDQAMSDLAKAKDNLLDSEEALREQEEASQRSLQDKEEAIHKLDASLSHAREELSQREQELSAVSAKADQESQALREEGKMNTKRLGDALTAHLKVLRKEMAALKSDVVSNKVALEASIVSALVAVEGEVSRERQEQSASHAGQVEELLAAEKRSAKETLENVKAEYETALKSAATKHALELELELDRCGSELKEKDELLSAQADEIAELKQRLACEVQEARRAAEQEREQLALAYSDNLRQAEESNNKGMEAVEGRLRLEFEEEKKKELTKSMIKHQLELNRVQEETQKERESALNELRLQLNTEHEQNVSQLQEQLGKKHETVCKQMKEHLEREHQEKIVKLEQELKESVDKTKAAEKERKMAVAQLKEDLERRLEEKQLEQVEKLTQLKTEFEQERDLLQAQLSTFTDKSWTSTHSQTDAAPVTDASTQPHIASQSDTGTETNPVVVSDASTEPDPSNLFALLSTSETQTEVNLLAEVISLNSSISYGSEEMIAPKIMTLTVGEESSKASIDADTKLASNVTDKSASDSAKTETGSQQDTIDDLNLQLACAQEKIASLNDEMRTLKEKAKESKSPSDSPAADVSPFLAQGDTRVKPSEKTTALQDIMTSSTSVAQSFILMETSQSGPSETSQVDLEKIKSKDQKIAMLEKQLKTISKDKVSIRGCNKHDIVLLCLDESHDQYVVFTVGTYLHFLHTESMEVLGLKSGGDSRCKKSWILAEVMEKEFCLAKKPNNRFRVPQGTCFYRVKCKPWKSDCEPSTPPQPVRVGPEALAQLSVCGSSGKSRSDQHGPRSKRSKDTS